MTKKAWERETVRLALFAALLFCPGCEALAKGETGMDVKARAGMDAEARAGMDAEARAGMDAKAGAGLDAPGRAGLDAPGRAGMDAQGVSAWHALTNPWRLDVRDGRNRSVSGRVLEKQLKGASAQAAADSAFASTLPAARVVTLALELLESFPASLRRLVAALPFRAVQALQAPRPLKLIHALALLGALAGPVFGLREPIPETSPFHPCPLPALRC